MRCREYYQVVFLHDVSSWVLQPAVLCVYVIACVVCTELETMSALYLSGGSHCDIHLW